MTEWRESHPGVLVWRDELLPLSEAFVVSPLDHLRCHRAALAGTVRVSPESWPVPTWILREGASSLALPWFRLTGRNRAFDRWLDAFDPALVHAHFGLDACQILPLARRRRLPLLASFHGYDVFTPLGELAQQSVRGRLYARRLNDLIANGSRFLAASNAVRERLLAMGFPEERVRLHYIGVDTEYFQPPVEPGSEQVVAYVGRLVEVKGLPDLLAIWPQVVAQAPGTRLVIIGDGPLRASCEQQARESGGRIEFLGAQPRAVVRQVLHSSRVLCSPSRQDAHGRVEAFGLANIEAQACGVPVVGYRSGGLPEAVLDGVTGILVAEGDRPALAQALLELLLDQPRSLAIGEAARSRVVESFDVAQRTAVLEGIYKEVVAARS